MALTLQDKKGVKLLTEAAQMLGWTLIVHTDSLGETADDDEVIGITVGETEFLDDLSELLDRDNERHSESPLKEKLN